MTLDISNIENTVLRAWVHELSMDLDDSLATSQAEICKDWFRAFDKIARHFPSWLCEPHVVDHVLETFPIEYILKGRWGDSTAHLSQFFGNSMVLYGEPFHLELISRYTDLAWSLRDLPIIQETMPALNNLLILLK